MNCDTLADFPETTRCPQWIESMVFEQVRPFHGVVFAGAASKAFAQGIQGDWGPSVDLNEHEKLQLRIYPHGVFAKQELMKLTDTPVMIATRITTQTGYDRVAVAVLWHPAVRECDKRVSPFATLKETSQPVATRHLFLTPLTIFRHHDAEYAAAMSTGDEDRMKEKWPIYNQRGYHVVKPSSLTVSRVVKMPDAKAELTTQSAMTGVAPFLLAGQFGNLDIEDMPRKPCQQAKYSLWEHHVDAYTDSIFKTMGFDGAISAMSSALHATELMSAEGILALLGNGFMNGAMPDFLHMPCALPLQIAMATRMACFPERFDFMRGLPTDTSAARELISLFESAWEPLPHENSGVYAIDMVLRGAQEHATNMAKLENLGVTEADVVDQCRFWYRAGARCVTSLFGPQLEDFLPARGDSTAHCDKVIDPLAEAKCRALQKRMDATMSVANNNDHVVNGINTVRDRRSILLDILNSVEHWLRTGSYAGIQVNRSNVVTVNIRRGNSPNPISKADFIDAVRNGTSEMKTEELMNRQGMTKEQAQAVCDVMSKGMNQSMLRWENEQLDLNNFKVDVPLSLLDQRNQAAASGTRPEEDEYGDMLRGMGICQDAFETGMCTVVSCMLYGPRVEISSTLPTMDTYLVTPYSGLECADCEDGVHVTTAVLLQTQYSFCPDCHRPRCNACTTIALAKARSAARESGGTPGQDTRRRCLRCHTMPERLARDVKAARTKASTAPPARKKGKAGR